MPSRLVRCMLFFSSYFPLMIILSILQWRANFPWAVGVLLVAFVSLGVTLLYIWRRQHKGGVSQGKIIQVEKRDENVVSYIVTYLVPFVTFPLATPEQVVALLVFVAVLLVLYINSNMLYINPMLNLLGWHLYQITLEGDDMSSYLITKQRRIKLHKLLYYIRISDNFYLEKVKKSYDGSQS